MGEPSVQSRGQAGVRHTERVPKPSDPDLAMSGDNLGHSLVRRRVAVDEKEERSRGEDCLAEVNNRI
jgi:hypothetical protein